MTMQRSHTSDDATQPCNAPHGCYGLDSAIVTTQRSQPSDDATQPRNAPARHNDDDSLTCIQHVQTASHSLTSVVPSWVSSSVPNIRLTCLSMYSSEPRCDALTTQRSHDPDNTIQPRLDDATCLRSQLRAPPPTHHNHAPRAVDKELYNIFIRLSIIDAT
ncbi:hypothetical protein BU15DRAFT_63557 [Melanogaster broomeanus]|nr:hypothetical protein BU15DRAFT_63557 [Melanogaster broomeanus]